MTEEERAQKQAQLAQLKALVAQAQEKALLAQTQKEVDLGNEVRRQQPDVAQTHNFMGTVKAAPEKPADPDTPWYEDIARGAGLAPAELVLGAKGLINDGLSPIDQQALKMWRDDVEGSGAAGTAGNVAGEIAQLALPAGLFRKALQAGKASGNLLRAGSMAGDIGLSGLEGYVRAPNREDYVRAENATESALMATMGGVGAGVLGKIGRGIRKTPEGQKLLDEGIDLTPAMASSGNFPKALETVMRYKPFLAKGAMEAQQNAIEQWNTKILNQAAPEGVKITGYGHAGFNQLEEAVSKAYDEGWSLAKPLDKASSRPILQEMYKNGARLDDESRRILGQNYNELIELRNEWTPERLRAVDRNLRSDITSAADKNNRPLMNALKETRRMLREASGEESASKLRAVDKKYDEFLAIQDATIKKESRNQGGVFFPQALGDSSHKIAGKKNSAKLNIPFAQEIGEGIPTVGTKFIRPLVDQQKALSQNTPSPQGLMNTMGKVILGETKFQKKAQQNEFAKLLRELGLSGATIGGAYGSAEEYK